MVMVSAVDTTRTIVVVVMVSGFKGLSWRGRQKDRETDWMSDRQAERQTVAYVTRQ